MPPKAAKIKDAENSLSYKLENVMSEQMALESIKCGSEYDMCDILITCCYFGTQNLDHNQTVNFPMNWNIRNVNKCR